MRAPSRPFSTAVIASIASLALAPASTAQFTHQESLVPGFHLPQLLHGDIDADGAADLLVVDEQIRWLSGPASATAGSLGEVGPDTMAPAFSGYYGEEVALVDFDQDGDLDVLAVVQDELQFIERLGGGTFAPPVTLDQENLYRWADLEVLDFDGDGVLDVVWTSTGLSWQKGLGGASLGPLVTLLSVDSFDGTFTDFDLDGDLDYVHLQDMQQPSTEVWVLRNDGGWQSWTSQRASVVAEQPGLRLGVGDLDGDGLPDYLFSSTSGVYRVQNLGGGSWGPPVLQPAPFGGLLLNDLDGDGDPDLLTQGAGLTPSSWRENVGGTFGPSLTLPDLPAEHRSGLGDLDGDGRDDLFWFEDTLDRGIFWRRNEGASASALFGPKEPVLRTLDRSEVVFTGDLDGDGDDDALVVEGQLTTEKRLVVALNRAAGAGLEVQPLTGPRRIEEVRVGDLDGDGDDDVVLREQATFDVFWSQGDGTFVPGPAGQSFGLYNVSPFAIADLDGDGAVEIVAKGRDIAFAPTLSILGGPAFDTATTMPTHEGGRFYVVDVDNNGSLDLVVSRNGLDLTYVHFGSGTLQYPPAQSFSLFGDIVGWADLNGDGGPEVIVSREWSSQEDRTAVQRFDFGAFLPEVLLPVVQTDLLSCELVDVTGTGQADLWVRSTQSVSPYGPVHLKLERTGPGLADFAPAVVVDLPVETSVFGTALLDIDADGDLDVLAPGFNDFGLRVGIQSALGDVGSPFCPQPGPNSTGMDGELTLGGSDVLQTGRLTMRASGLPAATLALFVTSASTMAPVVPPGSDGALCLGGPVGRFAAPGQIRATSATGDLNLEVDVTALPVGIPDTPAAAGETWSFQAWYRDIGPAGATSRFTTGSSVTFQ